MSRKERIAIVTRTIGCGGAETVMLNLGKFLNGLEYEVEILTTGDPGDWFNHISEMGLKGKHINGRYKFHHVVHSYRVGRKLVAGNYRVILLSNSERYAQAAINMFANNVIAIPWIHNDVEDAYRKGLINEKAWNVAVGVSPKVAIKAASMTRKQPVVYIPNGIEQPTKRKWKNRRKWSHPLRLVYVGRIYEKQKGVLFLPEIMKESQKQGLDVGLNIIGDGEDIISLKEKISALGVYDVVRSWAIVG